jgi:hypothetical protein
LIKEPFSAMMDSGKRRSIKEQRGKEFKDESI